MILAGAVARHERRVRLLFDRSLAPAALTTASLYTIAGPDGSPVPVVGLVLIAGQLSALDLAMGADLAQGTPYMVGAGGIPAQDGSATPDGTTALVRLGTSVAQANSEVAASDIDALLYGVDLVWSGDDYAETAGGDLATVSGTANVEAALDRRLTSNGLPWDDTYGAKPRAFVDGAPGALPSLQGSLVRQAQVDDRVKTATCSFVAADDSSSASFHLNVQLIGQGDAVSVTVKPNASQ